MIFQEYLKYNLNIETDLPFEITSCKYPKGSQITQLGNVEQNIYYIVSGIVVTSMETGFGEKIIDFTFQNQLVTSLSSLLKGIPSDASVTCLKDCEIQIIPYAKLNEACKTSLTANMFYKHFLENYYLVRVQKEKDFLSKSVEQRYLDILKNRPQVIQQIPLGYIAKYLGVHPNSLSRIRKKIATPKSSVLA